MPPRRKPSTATKTSASPTPPPDADADTRVVTTIVPPQDTAFADSVLPSWLRLPLAIVLSFALSALGNTLLFEYTGPRLAYFAPDGNPQWQAYAAAAYKAVELSTAWLAGFDGRDVLSLTLISHVPHLYLLHNYYLVPYLSLAALFFINTASTVVPFFALRGSLPIHLKTTPDLVTSDPVINLANTALGTLLYTLPYLALTITGILPRFLAVRFVGLRTLEAAHASSLPSVSVILLPLGYAATQFFFVPAAHALASAKPTTLMLDFDPVAATLGQTLHRNLLWHLYLPERTREAYKRVIVAALLTFASTAFWAWLEVEGVEPAGAAGWAGVWAAGTALAGASLAWVAGLSDG